MLFRSGGKPPAHTGQRGNGGLTYPKPQKPQQRDRMRAQAPAQLAGLCRRLHSRFLRSISLFFPSLLFPFVSLLYRLSSFRVAIVSYRSCRRGRNRCARERALMTAEGTIRGASVNHEEPRAAREGGERRVGGRIVGGSDRGQVQGYESSNINVVYATDWDGNYILVRTGI